MNSTCNPGGVKSATAERQSAPGRVPAERVRADGTRPGADRLSAVALFTPRIANAVHKETAGSAGTPIGNRELATKILLDRFSAHRGDVDSADVRKPRVLVAAR